jgi:hypothetical protein
MRSLRVHGNVVSDESLKTEWIKIAHAAKGNAILHIFTMHRVLILMPTVDGPEPPRGRRGWSSGSIAQER